MRIALVLSVLAGALAFAISGGARTIPQLVIADPRGLEFTTLDGHVQRRLGPKPIAFAFSRGGNQLAFETLNGVIWVIPPTGGRALRVGEGNAPAWSPGGGEIVATDAVCDEKEGLVTYVLPRRTATLQLRRKICGTEPSWSPDGTEIAFARAGGIALTDGGAPQQLTRVPGDQAPQWSPDGTQLAFLRERPTRRYAWEKLHDLYVMDADGSHVRRVLRLRNRDIVDLDWSSDGAQFALNLRTTWWDRSGVAVIPTTGGSPCLVSVGWTSPSAARWRPGSAPGTLRPRRCLSLIPPRPPAVLRCNAAGARSAVDRSRLSLWAKSVGHHGSSRLFPLCVDFDRDGRRDLAVLFDGGGTGAVTAWAAFRRTRNDWKLEFVREGEHMGVQVLGSDVLQAEPISNPNEPNCCPNGATAYRLYAWQHGRLRLVRRWQTAS